jgi:hypothetical protein
MGIKKRAMFFSSDALIAIILLVSAILIVVPFTDNIHKEEETSGNILSILSTLKIGEINNAYAQQMIQEGKIENKNNSILEQIGEFYLVNQSLAEELAQSIMENLDLGDTNIGIWYGDDLIYSKNDTLLQDAKNIQVESQTITGLKKGESVRGFSSRAFLQSNLRTDYFYFGGYVGDGNISVLVNYTGNLEKILVEITANEDFDIYINDEFSGHYQNSSSDFVPAIYDLGAYSENFNSGENILKFIGNSQNLHIAGGYIKITSSNTSLDFSSAKKYYFPGIEGLINVYDGFFSSKEIKSMEVYLHLDSEYSIFLNIGNTTIFRNKTEGENSIFINNSTLANLLDFKQIINETIPLRLGMENISYAKSYAKFADVFSVTDLSGSMGECAEYQNVDYCHYDCCTSATGTNCFTSKSCIYPGTCGSTECGSCPFYAPYELHHSVYPEQVCNKTKLDFAKLANKEFISLALNLSGNRVGLAGYSTSALDSNYHSLSEDNISLNNEIDSWIANGGTCICCGINKAVNKTRAESSHEKFKAIVVMSDGMPTYYCNSFEDFSGSGTIGDSTGSTSSTLDKQWAINASCNAWQNYGIKVYAIGFGDDTDTATMQAIAECGNGTYYYANVSALSEIYSQIAQEIINASYNEQTIEIIGNSSMRNILYPDSYIEIDYEEEELPHGLALSSEKNFYNSSSGNFTIPPNSTISNANIISYSGSRWTSEVSINSFNIFNLSKYGEEFVNFGDPYSIEIPVQNIGDYNQIDLFTSVSSENKSEGSSSNKIIYKIIKEFSAYSSISSISDGCTWILQFEDDSNKTMNIPVEYSGSNQCSYNLLGINYNGNDAIQFATYDLLKKMDFDGNNKLDIKFYDEELVIKSSEVFGIPYGWSTEVQVRTWN